MNKQNGFVFIDKAGEYAMVVPRSGHGFQTHMVKFTRDVSEATIFTNKNAYYGTLLSNDSRESLVRHCQCLKATATRVVRLDNWSDKDEAQPENVQQ